MVEERTDYWKKLTIKISILVFIVLLQGCINSSNTKNSLLDNLKEYNGEKDQLREILYDYEEAAKHKSTFKAYKSLIQDLSKLVKECKSEVTISFYQKLRDGDVYKIYCNSKPENVRYMLIKKDKIVSPHCFLKGEKIGFCF